MSDNSLLIIISSPPYEGSDVVWNALRLASEAAGKGDKVRIFLINKGVDTGRIGLKPPEKFFDLVEMLADTVEDGVEVKYCKICIDRCGIGEGDMIKEIQPGSMSILHEWITSSDKAVTF